MSASTLNFPFTAAQNDQSIYYLGKIFGNVGAVLVPSDASSQILGAMFQTFNLVVLGVGTMIVLYVTIVGVLKTAQEGQFLGQQWNNIWVPLRMVIGIAAVVPTPSGYCSIQIIVMWIVIQGVAAGDMIWNRVLGYTDSFGSPVSSVEIPTVGVGNNIQYLFQALVCQETAHYTGLVPPNTAPYYCSKPAVQSTDPVCSGDYTNITNSAMVTTSQQSYTLPGPTQADGTQSASTQTVTLNTYNMGPKSGYCGSMTYCQADTACNDTSSVTNQIRCNACSAQREALQLIVTALSGIAQAFVKVDSEYRMFWANPSQPPSWVASFCSSSGISGKQCCPAGVPNLPGYPDKPIGGESTPQDCKISGTLNPGPSTNAGTDAVLQVYWPFGIKPSTSQDIDFIGASTANYVTALQNVVNSVVDSASGTTTYSSGIKDQLAQARDTGWIFAGAFYYLLAKGNTSNYQASMPPWTVVGNDPSTDPSNPLYEKRNNYQAAGKLIAELSQQSQAGSGSLSSSTPPQLQDLNKLSDGLNAVASTIVNMFYGMVSGGQPGKPGKNPLLQLQALGAGLLIVAQVLFALMMIVIPAITLLGYFNVFVLGTGVDNSIGPTVTTLAIIFAPLFALLLGSLFTFGASLAVYVPLIPYIVFTMGAISWFVQVIEAMIASPIAALGILSPSAQHELFGKAADGLMYVFAVFLRPALMIFGLVAAMLMSMVVVVMINAAFTGVMYQIYQVPGLVEIMLFLGAYVMLILTALNKCFALIHIVPDRVLRWIGGHHAGDSGAEAQEGLQAAKGGVAAGAAGAAMMGGQAKGRGEAFNKMMGERLKAAKEQKEGELAPGIEEGKESEAGPEGGEGGGEPPEKG